MATIRDVAKLAGVAPITVSRVLNDSGYVSPAIRERVRRAAAELNYVPNMISHSFRSNRTHTLALVLTDITNPFWTTVARGAEDVASRYGFNVLFCNTDENEAKQEQYLGMLLRRRVDGVLLVPASSSGDPVHALQVQNIQVIVLDRRVPGACADLVRGDSTSGAHQLAEHLLQLGHRRIAILSGPDSLSVSAERAAGYQLALGQAGVALDRRLLLYGKFTIESGYAMAQQALMLQPRPTALFATNNFIAIGALRALHAAHLRVPQDMSIVAFDDVPYNYTLEPFLTVAVQPAYELGKTATKLLLKRIAEPALPAEYQDIVLPTEIIIRSSTGPVTADLRVTG